MADRRTRSAALRPHAKARGTLGAILTLEAIEALYAQGRCPTIREVAAERGLTLPGIQHHVRLLERAGLLAARPRGAARSFVVLDTGQAKDWVKVCRRVIPRQDTRSLGQIQGALLEAVTEALLEADMEGSEIELVIRHRP